ncbi:TPA: tetraacyldisaccharide 4'-kinase [bacterium]|nr:tetraacyldisaccharide 4'-kinase [bacterium]
MVDNELLDILACPKCKGDIEYISSENKLLCISCGLKYPIRDDIPIMLIEEAEETK